MTRYRYNMDRNYDKRMGSQGTTGQCKHIESQESQDDGVALQLLEFPSCKANVDF